MQHGAAAERDATVNAPTRWPALQQATPHHPVPPARSVFDRLLTLHNVAARSVPRLTQAYKTAEQRTRTPRPAGSLL